MPSQSDTGGYLAGKVIKTAGQSTRALAISGETGIGKSRLTKEITGYAAATGLLVGEDRCFEAELKRERLIQELVLSPLRVAEANADLQASQRQASFLGHDLNCGRPAWAWGNFVGRWGVVPKLRSSSPLPADWWSV